MKRKLDDNDVPQPTQASPSPSSNFQDLGLDARLLQAIAKEGFSTPTPVQTETIPAALEGRDIVARAKTGSGKTAAYLLPILESILRRRKDGTTVNHTTSLILVPTRELAHQVSKAVSRFTAHCSKEIRHVNLMQKVSEGTQRSLLASRPDIVICTPARATENLASQNLSLQDLKHLVIDEADLILSYGHSNDLKQISTSLPIEVQKLLVSATFSPDIDTLRDTFTNDPVIVELETQEDDGKTLSQFYVSCAEDDKFLFAFVIFKLKLVKGKCLIFVGDTDRCYRLKLFFEQFGVRSCVLNAELPVNTRTHVVEEFNKNIYDIIIASDDHEVLGDGHRSKSSTEESTPLSDAPQVDSQTEKLETSAEVLPAENPSLDLAGSKGKRKNAKDYGIARGIDFKNVACVLNFDLPTNSQSYIHRVGRTARAGQNGMALSFAVLPNEYRKSKATSFPGSKDDEKVIAAILEDQKAKGQEIKPYHFNRSQVDVFRYRINDALRAVTGLAIRQARTQELRRELLKSEKLQHHFEEHPDDLSRLRHDGEVRTVRVQQHLKHVPDYLMPESGAKGVVAADTVPLLFKKPRGYKGEKSKRSRMSRTRKVQKRRDPLRSFATKRKP